MSSAALQIVLTNCPDADVAASIARAAVTQQLAACANILAPCRSLYVWQGRLADETEVPLLLKTTAACFAALSALIRQLHPYELPEIVAVDVSAGEPAYVDWVAAQVLAPPAGQ